MKEEPVVVPPNKVDVPPPFSSFPPARPKTVIQEGTVFPNKTQTPFTAETLFGIPQDAKNAVQKQMQQAKQS